ncbi:MAG: pitrilysin family protein [Nitriliruptorales bacterium]|nr:pitrilysin family protein [Nitriliruptorales bacterium]
MQPRPTLAGPAPWTFPEVEDTAVDGIRLASCHLAGHPLVAVQVHLDVPVTVDPPGQEGLAALLAKGLKEGTRRLDAQAFDTAVELLGARIATTAGHGGLRASVSAPADRVADAVDLLTEAIVEPRLRDEDLVRLRANRLDEITSQEADPETRAWMLQRPRLWDPADRRSVAAAGSRESVAALEPDAVRDTHGTHVRRGGATLVVVGDLANVDVGTMAEQLAARLPEDPRPRTDAPAPKPTGGARAVVFHRPGSVQTALEFGRVGPGRGVADWPALVVAMHVLGGTLTSRLDAVLREEKGWTYGVRSRRSPIRGASVLTLLSGSVQSEVTPDAVEAAWQIMDELATDGPTTDETHSAVAYLAGVQPLTYETPRAVAGAIGSCLANDLPLDHVGAEIAALRDVTVDEATAAARTHLQLADTVLVAVGDADQIGPALEGRVGTVERLED